MKTQTASLLLAIAVLPFATAQACDMPVAPPTPDGGSATLEDMIAAQGEVKAFQAANAEYLECVDDLMASEKASVAEGDKSAEERFALAAQTITLQYRAKSRWPLISTLPFAPTKPPTPIDKQAGDNPTPGAYDHHTGVLWRRLRIHPSKP